MLGSSGSNTTCGLGAGTFFLFFQVQTLANFIDVLFEVVTQDRGLCGQTCAKYVKWNLYPPVHPRIWNATKFKGRV